MLIQNIVHYLADIFSIFDFTENIYNKMINLQKILPKNVCNT